MLAELLEVIDTDHDIVVLDRGFFDAFVWLDLQFRRDQITDVERDVFEAFVGLERWRSLVDAVVVLHAAPEVALAREDNGHLLERVGSLMNPEALSAFNESLRTTAERTSDSFELLEIRADQGADAKGVTTRVVTELLPRFWSRVDPQIACVPRGVVEPLFLAGRFIPWSDEAWATLTASAVSTRRSDVEASDELVQLVACGIATRADGILVFDRDARDHRTRSYGRGTIWQGPHVEHAGSTSLSLEHVRDSLQRRFAEDLHLSMPIDADASPIGLVWDPDVGQGHHIGIAIPIAIASDMTAEHLKDKKFRTRGRQHVQKSRFLPGSDLRADPDKYDLELWSRAILASGWPPT
jgi:predicted NUDIX family phosphoesterase